MKSEQLDHQDEQIYAFIISQAGGSYIEWYAEMFPTVIEARERIDEIREASHDALGPFECAGVLLKHRDAIIPLLNEICSGITLRRTEELSPLLSLSLEKFKKDLKQ